MTFLRHLFTTWRIKREIERNLAARLRAMPSARAFAFGRAPTGLAGFATSIAIARCL